MTATRARALPMSARLIALGVLLAGATLAASTAYTRDAARYVRYACEDGERFSVEYHAGHVRLRTGAGVFALTAQPADEPTHYSNGATAFRVKGEQAILERPGLATPAGCRAIRG